MNDKPLFRELEPGIAIAEVPVNPPNMKRISVQFPEPLLSVQIPEPLPQPVVPPRQVWPEAATSTFHQLKAPTTVSIGNLIDDRLRLRTPIKVEVEIERESYVVKSNEVWNLGFGYGNDPIEAIDDFRQSIAELYWVLKQEQSNLVPSLSSEWEELKRVIYEV